MHGINVTPLVTDRVFMAQVTYLVKTFAEACLNRSSVPCNILYHVIQ